MLSFSFFYVLKITGVKLSLVQTPNKTSPLCLAELNILTGSLKRTFVFFMHNGTEISSAIQVLYLVNK